jgi:hypothetical protein
MYDVVNETRFDLFVEVKPPGQSQCTSDQRKIGFEMKKMLDALVNARIPSPVVCGA